MPDLDRGPGSRLGEYVLDRVLGQGGMGTVYAGTHAQLGRRAAIKVLSSRLREKPEHAERFLREARIVSRLQHPNVVQVYDLIQAPDGGPIAYAMELIDGAPLGRVLKERGPFETREAIEILQQLLSALTAVHALPVIHRDLKPENILLSGDGPSVKILDFGIAKDPDSSIHTSTGMLLGTPAYMAPEQVAGDDVTPAADIYAVGEILFELLAGRRLFTGTNQEILMAKLAGQAPLEGFDHVLAPLIRRCLASRPGDRPSADAVARELREIEAAAVSIRTSEQLPFATPPIRSGVKSSLIWGLAILALASIAAIAFAGAASDGFFAAPLPLEIAPAAPVVAPPTPIQSAVSDPAPHSERATKRAVPTHRSVSRMRSTKPSASPEQAGEPSGPDLPTPLSKENLQGW
jgi:serine/threonine-protein kinase